MGMWTVSVRPSIRLLDGIQQLVFCFSPLELQKKALHHEVPVSALR